MKQMVRPDVDALTVIAVGDIRDKELVFVRNVMGAVFVVESGSDEATLFPVLTNGRISRIAQPLEPTELFSVIEPTTIGVESIKWTNHRASGAARSLVSQGLNF